MGQGQTHTNHIMSFKDSQTSQTLCSRSMSLLTRLPTHKHMCKYKQYINIHAHSDALQSLSCGLLGVLLSDFISTLL